MLSLRRNGNLPLGTALLRLLLILLQPYTVSDSLHGFPYKVELVDGLLETAPAGRRGVQAALEQIDKGLTVDLAHAGNVESNTVDLQLGLVLTVVELRLVQSDQLQHHHRNGEHVRLEDVVSSLVVVVSDEPQLLGREDVVLNLGTFAEGLEETVVPVLVFHLQQIDLDVAFGTQVDSFGTVLPNGNAVFLKVAANVQQTAHNINQFTFGEVAVLQLLLLNGLLQREIVVVAESMYFLMFDADLVFYGYVRGTLNQLAVVYFGDVLVVHVPDLVHETHVLPHTLVVLHEVLLEIHNVFVRRLLRTQNVHRTEITVLGTLNQHQRARVFGLQLRGL